MAVVHNWVPARISAAMSVVWGMATSGPKRRTYFFSRGSQNMKPGRTAAPVLRATWARPVAVHASMPKNSDECALRRGHVGVHEDADGAALVHGGEEAAAEVVFVEDVVAVHAADAIDVGVEAAVVESADDHAHGMAHEGVVEAEEVPTRRGGR